ncbi:MAG: type II toxin-antitoxin system HicB family antitoxin [Planctomycetota bacterium]
MPRTLPIETIARFDAVFERHGRWCVGYLPGVPGVHSQERTLQEARKSLRKALEELAVLDPRAVFGRRQRREVLEVRLRNEGA